MQLLVQCVPAFGRPRLIVYQVYNTGARSLIIIMLAGLFVVRFVWLSAGG